MNVMGVVSAALVIGITGLFVGLENSVKKRQGALPR